MDAPFWATWHDAGYPLQSIPISPMQASEIPTALPSHSASLAPRQARSALMCPECGGDDIARSRTRTVIERFAKIALRIRAYRCLDCRRRFFGWRRSGLGRPYG